MTGLLLTGLLLSQTPAPATPPPAPAQAEAPKPPELPRELALQVENVTLRQALLEAQVRATLQALQEQRAAIDAAVRAARPGWRMDWATGALVPAAKEAPAAKDGTP